MTTKLYCVHVYEKPHMYENVRASNPRAAEARIIAREWAGSRDNIERVEVMRQCTCGLDNALDEKTCTECGASLK